MCILRGQGEAGLGGGEGGGAQVGMCNGHKMSLATLPLQLMTNKIIFPINWSVHKWLYSAVSCIIPSN